MKYLMTLLLAAGMTGVILGSSKFLKAKPEQKCIQIFYDSKRVAHSVQKYLQDYSEYAQYLKDIEKYESGDIERCQATFYVGSQEESRVPRAFADDYIRTQKSVAWVGHNIWQLGDRLEKVFGLRYIGRASGVDFRESEILYEGRIFKRRPSLGPQIELLPVDVQKFEVLAGIRAWRSREVIPYAIRSKNRFYLTDLPPVEVFHREQESIFVDLLPEIIGSLPRGRATKISQAR